MKFLIKPKDHIWVAVQDSLTQETLKEKILGCDICISDLDDCDAHSPAKTIAKTDWLKRMFSDKDYLHWFFRTGYNLIKKGKKAESQAWQEYFQKFLTKKEDIQSAIEIFDKKTLKKSLYPSIEEFYRLLPNQYKIYLTRNLQEIGLLYGNLFGFNNVWGLIFDKSKSLDQFIKSNLLRNYFIKGDSEEDEEMLNVLKFHLNKKRINSYFSCYLADNPSEKKMNPKFDISIGKDYSGLVQILKS